jgi:hypothetical protein
VPAATVIKRNVPFAVGPSPPPTYVSQSIDVVARRRGAANKCAADSSPLTAATEKCPSPGLARAGRCSAFSNNTPLFCLGHIYR